MQFDFSFFECSNQAFVNIPIKTFYGLFAALCQVNSRAKGTEKKGKLTARDTAAHNKEAFGNSLQFQHASGIKYLLLIPGKQIEGERLRTGSNNELFAANGLLTMISGCHLNLTRSLDVPFPHDQVDLVFIE